MFDVMRAELFKLARRPAAWALLVAAALLNQAFAYLVPYLSYRSGSGSEGASVEETLAGTLPDQLIGNTIGAFSVFAGALALVLGALMLGGEYGWGTVKTVLTQRPGRTTVLAGQLSALAVALLVGVLLLFVTGAASAAAIALVEDKPLDWPAVSALAQGFGVGWLVMFMWAGLGAMLGVTLRGVALPIGLGVVWVLGVENLVSAMAEAVLSALEPVRDLLPGVNAGSAVLATLPDRVAAPPPGVSSAVSESRGLVTICCYVLVSTAVTWWVYRRRDVA